MNRAVIEARLHLNKFESLKWSFDTSGMAFDLVNDLEYNHSFHHRRPTGLTYMASRVEIDGGAGCVVHKAAAEQSDQWSKVFRLSQFVE